VVHPLNRHGGSPFFVAWPRWPHLPWERSRQAVLDILGHIVIENLLTQHGPNPHRSTAEGLSQASN
jgi:hypothetical protein